MFKCTLCGQTLEFISEHHAQIHNMTLEQYKKENIAKKVTYRDFKIPKNHTTEIEKYLRDTLEDRKNRLIKKEGV